MCWASRRVRLPLHDITTRELHDRNRKAVQMISQPFQIATGTVIAYSSIWASTAWLASPSDDARTNLKAISSLHSILTTTVGLYTLSQDWHIRPQDQYSSQSYAFNDQNNPLVFGKAPLGNAVTSVETGYLFFDTVALLLMTHKDRQGRGSSLFSSVTTLARQDPLTFIHHVSLLAALGYFQVYIAIEQERGIRIILAFILMNASTPLLHWRWWRRKSTGKNDMRLDVLLAIVFAACRLGTIVWVLKAYGRFHGVGAWEGITKQRLICQVSTGALFGLNSLWLANLLKGMARRLLRKPKA